MEGRTEMSEFPVGASALEGGAMHNTAALRYLYELFRYAMVLTRNQTDAEDLVQETYVRGLKAIGSLQPGSNVKSWLFPPESVTDPRLWVRHEQGLAIMLGPGSIELGLQRSAMERVDYAAGDLAMCPRHEGKWGLMIRRPLRHRFCRQIRTHCLRIHRIVFCNPEITKGIARHEPSLRPAFIPGVDALTS
jgi:hypothetical protein